ncbi:uncharacterized protein [Clytia hemisphaerica]|uniref:Daxx histone-binding domain-containing protein n=1 Tax=Clytia hemisphaerica TaxID=252671 RepID=A0A7M5VEL7_9CNID
MSKDSVICIISSDEEDNSESASSAKKSGACSGDAKLPTPAINHPQVPKQDQNRNAFRKEIQKYISRASKASPADQPGPKSPTSAYEENMRRKLQNAKSTDQTPTVPLSPSKYYQKSALSKTLQGVQKPNHKKKLSLSYQKISQDQDKSIPNKGQQQEQSKETKYYKQTSNGLKKLKMPSALPHPTTEPTSKQTTSLQQETITAALSTTQTSQASSKPQSASSTAPSKKVDKQKISISNHSKQQKSESRTINPLSADNSKTKTLTTFHPSSSMTPPTSTNQKLLQSVKQPITGQIPSSSNQKVTTSSITTSQPITNRLAPSSLVSRSLSNKPTPTTLLSQPITGQSTLPVSTAQLITSRPASTCTTTSSISTASAQFVKAVSSCNHATSKTADNSIQQPKPRSSLSSDNVLPSSSDPKPKNIQSIAPPPKQPAANNSIVILSDSDSEDEQTKPQTSKTSTNNPKTPNGRLENLVGKLHKTPSTKQCFVNLDTLRPSPKKKQVKKSPLKVVGLNPLSTGSNSSTQAPGSSGATSSLIGTPLSGTPLKVSKKARIKILEKKLESMEKQINQFAKQEVSLYEMDHEESAYIQEAKLKENFVRLWTKYCKLVGDDPDEVVSVRKKVKVRASPFPEINREVERYVNRSGTFPNIFDIKTVCVQANNKYELSIRENDLGGMARDIFVEVGQKLQKNRERDLRATSGNILTDEALKCPDPALEDVELKTKLKRNRKIAKKKTEDVFNDFVQQQYDQMRGAANVGSDDDTEENDDDEEDDHSEIESLRRQNLITNKKVKQKLIKSKIKGQPPSKKMKSTEMKKKGSSSTTVINVTLSSSQEEPQKKIDCQVTVNASPSSLSTPIVKPSPTPKVPTSTFVKPATSKVSTSSLVKSSLLSKAPASTFVKPPKVSTSSLVRPSTPKVSTSSSPVTSSVFTGKSSDLKSSTSPQFLKSSASPKNPNSTLTKSSTVTLSKSPLKNLLTKPSDDRSGSPNKLLSKVTGSSKPAWASLKPPKTTQSYSFNAITNQHSKTIHAKTNKEIPSTNPKPATESSISKKSHSETVSKSPNKKHTNRDPIPEEHRNNFQAKDYPGFNNSRKRPNSESKTLESSKASLNPSNNIQKQSESHRDSNQNIPALDKEQDAVAIPTKPNSIKNSSDYESPLKRFRAKLKADKLKAEKNRLTALKPISKPSAIVIIDSDED